MQNMLQKAAQNSGYFLDQSKREFGYQSIIVLPRNIYDVFHAEATRA